VGILFASQLGALAQWVSGLMGAGDSIARQIANAQLIFNTNSLKLGNTIKPRKQCYIRLS
jgi:phosphate:Na+ symporter